jgi:hypothetical protein
MLTFDSFLIRKTIEAARPFRGIILTFDSLLILIERLGRRILPRKQPHRRCQATTVPSQPWIDNPGAWQEGQSRGLEGSVAVANWPLLPPAFRHQFGHVPVFNVPVFSVPVFTKHPRAHG